MAYYAPAKKKLRSPKRCPECTRKGRIHVVGYADGSKVLACLECHTVLQEREQDFV